MRDRPSSTSGAARLDIYQKITNAIIAQIEAGTGRFQMPWHHDGCTIRQPRNVWSRLEYRGINAIALWVAAHAACYPTGIWGTYKQWLDVDAQVRKGETGTSIVFWKRLGANGVEDIEDDEPARPHFVARGYTVFNAAQVDGHTPRVLPELPEIERITRAERFYCSLEIDTRFGGDEAYYVPAKDYVQMPAFPRFRNAIAFYATLLHEGAHATAAPHRLDRNLSSRFGSTAYAMEEMIADWASCLACMTLELCTEPRDDHACYIASWLKVLRGDKRAVFMAASKAQDIVDWMWAQQSCEDSAECADESA